MVIVLFSKDLTVFLNGMDLADNLAISACLPSSTMVTVQGAGQGGSKSVQKLLISTALCSVRTNGLSIRQAAKKYGIPRSTLSDHYTAHMKPGCGKPGRKTFFTQTEEQEFVTYIQHLSSTKNPISKKSLLFHAAHFAKSNGKTFKNQRPTKKWLQGFLSRHPYISMHVSNCPELANQEKATTLQCLHNGEGNAYTETTHSSCVKSYLNLPYLPNESGLLELPKSQSAIGNTSETQSGVPAIIVSIWPALTSMNTTAYKTSVSKGNAANHETVIVPTANLPRPIMTCKVQSSKFAN